MGDELYLQRSEYRRPAAWCMASMHYPPNGSPVRTILTICGALLLSVLAPLHAQETGIPRFELGPAFGIGYGLQSGEFPIRYGSANCGIFSGGRIVIPRVDGVMQWQQLFGEHAGLELRLGYSPMASRYTAPPTDRQLVVDVNTHTLVELDREFHLDATFKTASLAMLFRYRAAGALALSAGPTLGYRVQSKFTETDNVLDPGRSFADGERSRATNVGSSFTVRRFALGAALSVEYPLQLWKRATLVPTITLGGDLLSAVAETPWRSASATAGVTLLFDLTRKADTVIPPPPPPRDTTPPPPPKPPALNVAIALHGINEAGVQAPEAVVSVREVIFRKHTPLLPVMYFDEESDSIPPRYVQIQAGATDRFTYRSLAELGPLELSHSVLNLIGLRMRNDKSIRLTLYGLASSDETKGRAIARAERVQGYLADVWGIHRSRIDTRTGTGPIAASDDATDDGRAENRRVIFASSSADLLAPIATERVVRDFNPPLLKLDPTIEAEAGLRSWTITVRQGSDTLATFINGSHDSLHSDIAWRLLDEQIDSGLGRVVAEIRVEDSTGQRKNASDSIELRLRRDSIIVKDGQERHGETERLSYSLVAFGYRSATGDRSHEIWLQELTGLLESHAHIEVRGYTDRIGDDTYNLDLSRGRAQYVADRLRALTAQRGIRDLQWDVQGAGVDVQRFPNNLPEGRVLSRGATVVAEQPANKDGGP